MQSLYWKQSVNKQSVFAHSPCLLFSQTHVFIPQGYFSECLFIILSFTRLLPPPRAMTSYFLNWLSSSFPLLILQCPFLSEKFTLSNCFSFPGQQKLFCTSCKPLCVLSMIAACSFRPLDTCLCARVRVWPPHCTQRFHINLNPAFFQIRFLFFCLHVDLFASLSSSPARLSLGRQCFYGNKGHERWGLALPAAMP